VWSVARSISTIRSSGKCISPIPSYQRGDPAAINNKKRRLQPRFVLARPPPLGISWFPSSIKDMVRQLTVGNIGHTYTGRIDFVDELNSLVHFKLPKTSGRRFLSEAMKGAGGRVKSSPLWKVKMSEGLLSTQSFGLARPPSGSRPS
jgi:hypothetical protein